ncbi:MAG: UvrD-helicase domain-containing protein, partial [Clostridioides sp.]|nr:UvrD-helicase domain-containing protein [Clostridioides sp.]
MSWTKEQSDVIVSRNCNLLVSAAAGSGKTAVLVERIIQMITDVKNRVDIDKLLVVTFTNAAASEMKERIGDAILKKLETYNKEDNKIKEYKFLNHQLLLLNKSHITTIHSFCLDVIRANFNSIDIDPNFRIGNQTECNLIKNEALEEVFDELYDEENEGFLNLIESYAEKNGDSRVQKLILDVHNFIKSLPEPKKWLEDSVEVFNVNDNFDFSTSNLAKILLEMINVKLEYLLPKMKKVSESLDGVVVFVGEVDAMQFYRERFKSEYINIASLYEASKKSWNDMQNLLSNFEFEKFNAKGRKKIPKENECEKETYEEAKKARDEIKKEIEKLQKSDFIRSNEDLKYEFDILYKITKTISEVVIKFDDKYNSMKREKSIIDFNDIEHFAFKILTEKDENGNLTPSNVARNYQDYFEEVMTDEYQDSNLIQEVIMQMVSKQDRKNRFMVGDVKQSIYRFRQARPELFLQKYYEYSLSSDSKLRKILLYKNF